MRNIWKTLPDSWTNTVKQNGRVHPEKINLIKFKMADFWPLFILTCKKLSDETYCFCYGRAAATVIVFLPQCLNPLKFPFHILFVVGLENFSEYEILALGQLGCHFASLGWTIYLKI